MRSVPATMFTDTHASYRRQRLALVLSLAVLIGLAWAYMVSMSAVASPGTGAVAVLTGHGAHHAAAAPGAPRYAWLLAMWTAMAVAMMLPTAIPLLMLFARYWRAKHGARSVLPATWSLVAGYLGAWIAFAAAAAGLERLLEGSPLLDFRGGALHGSIYAGAVIATAGVFQLTPLKTACLRKCRSPMMFLNTRWRDGFRGALLMGLDDGLYCLGCCWALMLLMFVTGVMNLLWMAALTALMIAEKLVPRGLLLARVTGIVLVAAGIWRGLAGLAS